jgi:hypothetical protein
MSVFSWLSSPRPCAGFGQQRRRREVGGQQKIVAPNPLEISYSPLLDKKKLGVFEISKVGLAKA